MDLVIARDPVIGNPTPNWDALGYMVGGGAESGGQVIGKPKNLPKDDTDLSRKNPVIQGDPGDRIE